MIPVMIITEGNMSIPYFSSVIYINDSSYQSYKFCITADTYNSENSTTIFATDESSKLRDKVLELLHKEVANCFEGGKFQKLFQTKFQIYLKDIIEKAKEELNNDIK